MTFVIRDRDKAENAEEAYIPTAEEEAMLEESIAQIERGEWIDGDEFLRELRLRLGNNRGTIST